LVGPEDLKVGSRGVIGKEATNGYEPEPFRPTGWMANRHVQTVGGRLLRRARPPAFVRERIELPDGDFVDLDFAAGAADGDGPLVLLLHGLEGSARRGYAINVYRELASLGIRAVGLNFRSCSGELNRSARAYHSGDTGDIEHVLRLLREREPETRFGAIGFSLGGNALLKLLGERGEAASSLIGAAVAVSVPYDLGAGADCLETSVPGRFYTRRFVRSLVAKAEAKAALLPDVCDLERVRIARTFREFDDAFTAPLHGFRDAADYYAQSSSRSFIAGIRVPVLLLHAGDDPFLPAEYFPYEAVAANPWVRAVVTPAGGHVGFIEGPVWAPRFWAERQAARYLAHALAVTARGAAR
jgi:uncharacterized protein